MCVELACGYSNQTLTKIIAYFGITIYSCWIAALVLFGLIVQIPEDCNVVQDFNQSSSDSVSLTSSIASGNQEADSDDLMQWLENLYPLLFVIWLVVYSGSGLILSFVLLEGAQKRNLLKVKVWFFLSIISYLLWIPIYAYWVCHAEEPINALMTGFMGYMLGGLCLWVVSAFIEELRIESISHRVGYKDDVPFYKI